MSDQVSRRSVVGGVLGVVGLGAIATLAGCAPSKPDVVPSDDGVEAAVTVRAIDNAFEPEQVEVAPGEAVTWVFEGNADHDVVASDGSFVSELQRTGSYTHVFKEAGTFMYDCSIHPEMTGVVTVTAQ